MFPDSSTMYNVAAYTQLTVLDDFVYHFKFVWLAKKRQKETHLYISCLSFSFKCEGVIHQD